MLVVDDEVHICRLLFEFLSGRGHQVYTASDGIEGLLKYEQRRPEVVILDISMPRMNGIEVLCRIREIDKRTKIIILSAYGNSTNVRGAMKMGAQFFLEKPVEIERLMNILAVL